MIGAQVLNYRIDSKIGEGGMGSVYLASHLQMRRKAAIKALHPNLVNNAQIRERFRNEAEAMASLKHPNIIDLYDFLETNQGLFLIMEYVDGNQLDDYIRSVTGPLSEERAVELFSKALDGFAYAHDRGIIHRDIKPSNLMIGSEGQVKILDFGIAKILNGANKGLTRTGSKMGTVLYMSPEQVKGQSVDRRSDIYSMGVTLFQILTGRPPYDEKTATEYEVYTQIVNSPLPRLRQFNPKVSERIQAVVDKATAKEPSARFQNALEFKQALLGITQQAQTNPGHQGYGATKLATSSPETVVRQPRPQNQRPQGQRPQNRRPASRRKSSGFNFLPLLIILLLGVLSYLVLWNPLKIKELEKVAYFSEEYQKTNTGSEEERTVKKTLSKLFDAVESHDFEKIKPFYQEKIEDYFGQKNITRDRDLRIAYEKSWKDIVQEERHDVDWDSLKYKSDEEGNHIVTFSFKYSYKSPPKEGEKEKVEWKSYKRKAEIRLNKDYLVYYQKGEF
ncbi:hypothetical protein BKI52_23630 [marine bacterium AO1-C]|nr:hypothetical protein BKI52_23630 [marine bacterium AO1-C]